MVRWIVIGAVGVVAFTIYALVDLFMTHNPRVRAFPKPIWIIVIVALPVVGPLLWLFIGKSKPGKPQIRSTGRAPEDDPSFLTALDREASDDRIRRLEEELRKLDEEDQGGPRLDDLHPDAPDEDSPPKTS